LRKEPGDSLSFFDENYGEGALNSLIETLKFNGITPAVTRDIDIRLAENKIKEEEALGELFIEWQSSSYKATMQIAYSSSYWIFVYLGSENTEINESVNNNNLLGFLCYELANFAKNKTSITKFICTASDSQTKTMFIKSGFTDIAGNLSLEADLYEFSPPTSKLEEYGNWCKAGKNPDSEPSWRKEI
jgi:hypothetical protein